MEVICREEVAQSEPLDMIIYISGVLPIICALQHYMEDIER